MMSPVAAQCCRAFAAVTLGLALAGPTFAAGFAATADHIHRLLVEAREIEAADPARAITLRQVAQAEFQRLRSVADELGSDLDSYRSQIVETERDGYWGALWATLEGAAHTSLAVDKAVDLAAILTQADRDPKIKALLEAKELAHTAVDVYEDMSAGETGRAVTRIVREHAGNEAEAGLGILESIRRAEEGDLTGAAIEAGEAGAALVEDLGQDSTAFRAWSKALDAAEEVAGAAESFGAAGDFIEGSQSHSAAGRRLIDRLAGDNTERRELLESLAAEHPELFDPQRSDLTAGSADVVLQLLAGMGLDADQANAMSPLTSAGDGDPELDPDDTRRRLDEVTGAVEGSNEEAAWGRRHSARRDRRIGDLQQDAFDRWLDGLLDGDPSSDHEDDDEEGAPDLPGSHDHCAGGTFQCPNGLPWPDCTHAEKYDCPPAEYRDVAADDAEEITP
jgi:hypothetical protein